MSDGIPAFPLTAERGVADVRLMVEAAAGVQQPEAKRLDSAAWIEAALDQLAQAGIDGVRVELLAKRLGVTKGSFYWHFKDRDELFENMLSHWRRRATLGLIERLDRDEVMPRDRFHRLLRLPLEGKRSPWGADIELALRMWGRRDKRARVVLEEVDHLRLRYIESLLVGCGTPPEAAAAGAVLAYSYMRVAGTLIAPGAVDLMQQCEARLTSLG